MQSYLIIEPVLGVPVIKLGDDLANILVSVLRKNSAKIADNDIVCVASKVVSIAENRYVSLEKIQPSDEAIKLHEKIQRKDPRVLQLILDEVDNNLANIHINDQWIGARTKIGRILTSAGIDKVDENTVLLLPVDPDSSAKRLANALAEAFGVRVGMIITDSDGREDVAGATQVCIGTYGVPPIRKQNDTEETVCDMLAAAAGLVMGQRGNNVPAVVIRGFDYKFNETAHLAEAY